MIAPIFSLVIALLVIVLMLPTLSDLISLAWAAVAGRRQAPPAKGALPRLLFLVPAHDESLLIEACVRSLLEQHYPAERRTVVVIADNCTDATAELARASGAACLERTDLEQRGKPRAIAWALERLQVASYDAVVIIDADTVVDPGFAGALADAAPLADKAIQAFYDVSNPDENALTRMSTVFGVARYRFAFPLKQATGLNVPLGGNGMCIGTNVLARHGWNAFSICEDWEMYALLTTAGVPIEVAPRARLFAQEARSLDQSASQRKRWAAGKLTVVWRLGGALLAAPALGVRARIDALAELTAPGPAVHLGLVLLLAPLCLFAPIPGGTLLAIGLLASLVRHVAYTAAAIAIDPNPGRVAASFLYLPFYTAWRLFIQLTALSMLGDKPWVRTVRHVEPSSGAAS